LEVEVKETQIEVAVIEAEVEEVKDQEDQSDKLQ
jgi:hypothetical protein